ncbi:DUF6571 family protein [Actinomyces glycerinitolerans]|uniref:DUF6571 domain-containing protein n=1 Tax=Actinomyces glycerinitolerans TaxID=1892869 RepID=A0A1M4RZB1_9ACTO|nr:DUF6571 family protein [Actinomyces glycerinitolerans]SHE25047.1 Hypothetical protein ACGLYG10_1259 [Actinomyces glycerinitolerans]
MAFIKIDTDKMQTVIDNLEDRAEAIDHERNGISQTSAYYHDPVQSVVDATQVLPGFLIPGPGSGTMAAYASTMRDLAEELRSRRQEAIDINESGITMTNPDGTLSYYLPDPPPGTTDEAAYWRNMDTAANVHAYNTGSAETAKAEATELQEALANGTSSQGRTVEEILVQIDKHRDIPIYGAAFVDALGTEAFLNLTIDAQTAYKNIDQYGYWVTRSEEDDASFERTITTLGHVFAAASQPEVNGESLTSGLSREVGDVITTDGKQGLASAVTALMSVQDTTYGTDFVVNLASDMETTDYDPMEVGNPQATGTGNYLDDYSPDPMAGPLFAMSRNLEAANRYFTPTLVNPPIVIDEDGNATIPITDYDPNLPFTTRDGRTITAQGRADLLFSRTWVYGNEDALTAAYAAVSSQRGSTDGALDGRATWACGQALEYFGSHDFSKSSERTKVNLGVFAGNHAAEITGIATADKSPDLQYGYVTANDYAHGPKAKRAALKHVVASFADSDDAVSAAGQGIANYTHRAAHAEAAEDLPTDGSTPTPEQVTQAQTGMTGAYTNGRSAAAWVDEVADQANERSDTRRDKERAQAGAAFAIVGAIPHPAAAAVSAGGSTGLSLWEAASNDTVTDLQIDATAYNASITEVAVQHGLVDESYFPDADNPQSWYDPETKTITITDDTQKEQFQQWWASYRDDIGLSTDLMTVSQTAADPQDTELPED